MKKAFVSFICIILVCAIAVNLNGCTTKVIAQNLMEDIVPNEITVPDNITAHNADITDFAIRLFKESEQSGENTLISPLSVLCALAMTANGAQNETKEQIEKVLGITVDELNLYLKSYISALPQGEKYKLSLANSIWFTNDERFSVNCEFLQTNADYYGADIYKTPFDAQTLKDINNWVNAKTDKMIPEILDEIIDDAVMYLVNALAFDAEWSEVYEKEQISEDVFTKEDGTKQNVDFMYSSEDVYLEDEKACGFMKYYKDNKYAFVAMLPNDNVSIDEYIASLDGKSLNSLLANPQYTSVSSSIPKFETEYSVEMAKILKNMGMPKAFSDKAEFGGLGSSSAGNIYISRFVHKTFISVDEKGTKAGATAMSIMVDKSCVELIDPKEVFLDRPFVYMLVDCENNIPFFIGTMMDVEQ